jgi:transposase
MIPPAVRIFVCREPQDLRRSFDGLALITRQLLGADPRSGALYCFVNRRANRLKLLWWDRNGYCLLYKRLHRAHFLLPIREGDAAVSVRIDARALGQLLGGVDRPKKLRAAP